MRGGGGVPGMKEILVSKSPGRQFLVLERILVNPVDGSLHYELVSTPLRIASSDTAYPGDKEI